MTNPSPTPMVDTEINVIEPQTAPVKGTSIRTNPQQPVQIQVQPPAGWYDRVYSDVANNAFGVILGVGISLVGILGLMKWLGIKELISRLIVHVTLSTRTNQRMIDNQVTMGKHITNISERMDNIDRNVSELRSRE